MTYYKPYPYFNHHSPLCYASGLNNKLLTNTLFGISLDLKKYCKDNAENFHMPFT